MNRDNAIKYVMDELIVLKKGLTEGKSISPIKFLQLSEIFKFKIEPSEDRFTATILDEASKATSDEEHLEMIDTIINDTINGDEEGEEGEEGEEEELKELIDYDGSITSSKIPDGVQTVSGIGSKKTSDDVALATAQYGVWSSGGNFFKRYYGESIEEEDMSKVLGFDETKNMDAEETIEFLEKEYDVDDAEERAEEMGKNEKLDDKDQQRLFEKSAEDKAKDMIEVILSDKDDDKDLSSCDRLLNKKIKSLIKLAGSNGVSVDELRNMLK
tara:strand:- start:1271 stop:2083 length:813 start_codon:yes stop_codon:yes gene_type:complete